MVSTLVQNYQIHAAWQPVDVNAGAVTCDWIEVQNHTHFTFLGIHNDLAASTMTYTFAQADDSGGGNSAALTVIMDSWEMTHASSIITAGLVWAHTANSSAAATVAGTTAQTGMIVVDFESSQLTDGKTAVRCTPTEDAAAAQIAAGFWILGNSRYAQDVIATANS